ncbi:hypothetical protein ABBQ32_012375 [Trebouxia sp. C0010 RCD-2024]
MPPEKQPGKQTGPRRVILTVRHRGASGEADYYSRRGADAKAATVDQGSASSQSLKHPVRQSHCLLEAADASFGSAKAPVEEPYLGPQWQANQASRASIAEVDSAAFVKFVPKKRRRDATGTTDVGAELPLRKRVRFAEGTNFDMKPPPEWKRARLDDHHYGNDDSTIDDEGVNHMGATEVEDVRMANEAPPIVSNGNEDVYETDDEDYNYDGPTAEDVQRVMAEEPEDGASSKPPLLLHGSPPAEQPHVSSLSYAQPAIMSCGFSVQLPWSSGEEEDRRFLGDPSSPPSPLYPSAPTSLALESCDPDAVAAEERRRDHLMTVKLISADWMVRQAYDPTPPDHPIPATSQAYSTHAHSSSLQRRDKYTKKQRKGRSSQHAVDMGSAGVRKGPFSHRHRSNASTAQQADHGSAGSAAQTSGSAPPTAQKLSKEELSRQQFLDWYMNEATKEEKERRRAMLQHNRSMSTDAHIESAPTTKTKQDTAHGNSRASHASNGGLKRSHKPLPRKKNANNNHQGQSGGYPTPDTIPSTPKPSASLLTDIQQRANVTLEKALRAITDNAGQSGKLKALKVCLLAAAGHLKQAAEVTAKPTSSDHARCLASLQSAFHAVEGAAQAVQVPLQDSFLQQAYSLIIMKLRSACQLRLRLAERMLVRSTGQEPTTEQEREWKQRGACAASLLTEGSSSSRGALHRAANDSSLGTPDEKQRIRKLVLDLRPDFSASKNCM